MGLQVVIGYGPAGAATAALLAGQGEQVRVIGRSPRENEPGLEHVSLDAADQAALAEVTRGATAIYSCASPPYHRWASDWPPLQASICAAAEAHDALLVSLGNLYGYGPVDGPLTENLPLAATGTKAGSAHCSPNNCTHCTTRAAFARSRCALLISSVPE